MSNLKQILIENVSNEIVDKEQEVRDSDGELAVLRAKIKVEVQTLKMDDLEEYLKPEFEYSLSSLKSELAMEEEINKS